MSQHLFDRASIVSLDGTRIAYRSIGSGPGVALVHGAMQASQSLSQLARELSASFRVHVPDRRGRGTSGGFGPAHGIAREAEDLEALLAATGARRVFGLSSGALVSLFTATRTDAIERLAAYEPPLTFPGVDPAAFAADFTAALDRGHLATAMAILLQGTGDEELLTRLPRIAIVPLLATLMEIDLAHLEPGAVAVRDLVATVPGDLRVQAEASASLGDAIAKIRADVLLLSGDKSHPDLRASFALLARSMPAAEVVRLPGVGHIAADDAGKPREVARHLARFFSA